MSDLFGNWVPDDWIEAVLNACERAPQHRYLFLTKNPKRYEQVCGKYMSPNMWFGWTQTGPQEGLPFSTHHSVHTFVSIEPLLTPFEPFNIYGAEWVIIGAETGNNNDKVVPKKEWVDEIVRGCREKKIPVFMKNSLKSVVGKENMIREFPW